MQDQSDPVQAVRGMRRGQVLHSQADQDQTVQVQVSQRRRHQEGRYDREAMPMQREAM